MRKKLAVLFLGAALTVSSSAHVAERMQRHLLHLQYLRLPQRTYLPLLYRMHLRQRAVHPHQMFQQKAHRQRRLQEKAAHQSWKTVRIRQTSIQTAICSMSMKQKKERVS